MIEAEFRQPIAAQGNSGIKESLDYMLYPYDIIGYLISIVKRKRME